MSKLYSFDIFDTLITRLTANPSGIFAIVQEYLKQDNRFYDLPDFIKENFFSLRTETELFIRENKRNYGVFEITLNDIYDFIASNYSLTSEQKERLITLEIETEKRNIIPIEENIEKLKQLLRENKRVVLISDMYFSSKQLQYILSDVDSVFENLKLYVSSDYGLTKTNSELYKKVQQEENIAYSSWTHFGDNENGDIACALSLGINAVKFNYVNLKQYETDILKRFPDNAYISLVVGAAKNQRLFSKNKTEQYELGCSLGGPLLYPYIFWMLEETQKLNLNRLYFVMRDGMVLKELFDIVAEHENLTIETKLIYGSREAWRVPSITVNNPDINFMFKSQREINSIKKIALRFHVNQEKLLNFIPEKYKNRKRSFKTSEFEEVKNALINNPDFIKFVEEENFKDRELLKEYIKQEIDLSDDKFALVDLAASGRTQKCFVSMINEIKETTVNGFYAQFNGLKINSEQFRMKAFFTTRKVKSWLELFCRSACGYTKGYEKIDGKIEPVLEELEGKALKEYGYDDVIEGEKDFAKRFAEVLEKNPVIKENTKLFIHYLDYIAVRPTPDLARLIGDMPFSNYYGVKDEVFYCAPEITLKKLIFGYDKTQVQLPKLSYIRSSKRIKKLIDIQNKYGSIRKFFINIHFSKRKKQAFITIFGIKMSFRKIFGWR